MKLELTCATCFQVKIVDADTPGRWHQHRPVVDRPALPLVRALPRTCWKPVDGSVCFLDKGQLGLCRPWKDSYGDVLDGLPPITDLWTRA